MINSYEGQLCSWLLAGVDGRSRALLYNNTHNRKLRQRICQDKKVAFLASDVITIASSLSGLSDYLKDKTKKININYSYSLRTDI